jgi:glycosyltransferase involved in cell wall biosynthesis
MKILHIIPDLRKGGAERLVIDIIRELSIRPGINASIVIFRNSIEYKVEEIKTLIHAIPSSVTLSILKANKSDVSELQKFIDTYQPDVIHSHLAEAEIVSRSITYPKAKWFTHCHDNMPVFKNEGINAFTDKKLFARLFEKKFLFRRYDANGGTHFIAVSTNAQKYFQENLPANKYPVTLLSNATDLSRIKAKQDTSPKEVLTLINIGSFVKNKNQQLLVRIVKEISNRGIVCRCIMLGAGPELENVKALSKDMGVTDSIRFKGNVEDVSAYLSQSDIYVHTAFSESFGLVLLEAMGTGLPTVSLDNGGNKDIIENDVNGYILSEPEFKLFADKIIELHTDRGLYDKISIKGRESVKKYDIKTYVNGLFSIYEKDLQYIIKKCC